MDYLTQTDKTTESGDMIYTTSSGVEYVVLNAGINGPCSFYVIRQLTDDAIKLVRYSKGKVYKVTNYRGTDKIKRATKALEALSNYDDEINYI